MDLDGLQQKLIAAARANAPGEQVPYAFEKRIVGRLQTRSVLDVWAQWSTALWRAAASCAVVMVLFGGWSLLAPPANPAANDLSQEFENTVLAAVDQDQAVEPN